MSKLIENTSLEYIVLQKAHILFLSLGLISCTSSEPNYDYKSVQIDEIMENMDEPAQLLNRMSKSKHDNKVDWLTQLTILQDESHALIALHHPDKLFQDEAQLVAQNIDQFIEILPSLKSEAQFQKWYEVKKSCNK